MSWHMSPRYGHVIMVSGYPFLTVVSWPFCESNIQDVDLPRHAWDTPSSLLRVSSTPPLQSVDAYVRTLGQSLDNQTKRGWPYSISMGLCREARVGAPLKGELTVKGKYPEEYLAPSTGQFPVYFFCAVFIAWQWKRSIEKRLARTSCFV